MISLGPRLLSALALLLAPLVLAAGPARAHAIIVAAKPAGGAVVTGPSLAIELRFNSRIDRERSRLSLIGPNASTRVLRIDDGTAPDTLTATAKGLQPGAYRLRWQVLSVDGHITRGDIQFTVSG
jgi:methionine-rich copper-binding protein CopC